MDSKFTPQYGSSASITSPYTAPSAGIIYLTQKKGNVATTVAVEGVTILQMSGHSGSSHGQPIPCATVFIGKGQAITFDNCESAIFVPLG